MAARAWLWDRKLDVDAAKRTATIVPMRWPGVLFVPAFASTPIALAWVQFFSGTAHLTTGGWVFMIGYAALAAGTAVMFFKPGNGAVTVDFEARRLRIGAVEAPFADVRLRVEDSVRAAQGRSIPRSVLTATIGARTWKVLDLANKAAPLPRALADAIERNMVERLEAETEAAGADEGKRFVMTLGLLVAPGLMFAWAALR